MKKIIINLSDSDFEKFRFEAIEQKKSLALVITERIFTKPFSKNVEQAFDSLLEEKIQKILKD